LLDYAEIYRIIKQEEITPHLNFSEEISARPSSPKAKRGRKRSKSPKAKKALRARIEIPAEESIPSPLRPVEPSMVESRTVDGDREGNNDRTPKPGLTAEEVYTLLNRKIRELEPRERVNPKEKSEGLTLEEKLRPSHGTMARETPVPHGVTPGRLAVQKFFDRALCDSRGTSAKAKPPPSDPSDDSSSSSSEGPSSSDSDDLGSRRRSTKSPCLSSKRKRGQARRQKMLLKPIPPSRYNGEPNANAIQRFARESKTYVKMGRVPEDEHVYFISHYLDGKALDFYNQVRRGKLGLEELLH
jgi:hypothetical protein